MANSEVLEQLRLENEQLKKRLQTEVKKNCIKEELCIQQSKMAAMGEMIGSIAHQWRQPLMEISSLLVGTEAKIRFEDELSKKEILQVIAQSNDILKYMSQTIDDFRNFYSKDKEKRPFKISDQIKRVVNILSTTLENKNIKVNIVLRSNPTIWGYKNEYSQVLLNIISNAKDALIQRDIEKGQINVTVYAYKDYCITEIVDNAGGIKQEYSHEIFKPFMTYEKQDGTGVGLFMSKLIIESNMNGELTFENVPHGAKFVIKLPIS